MTLHNEQDAIKQAVEAGYDWNARRDYMAGGSASTALLTTDPAFWQALGKARGWDMAKHDNGFAQFSGAWEMEAEEARNAWKKHALRYFEQRLSGGNLEEFWRSLP